MSARRTPPAATDHSFRLRGATVTFRATALGSAIRVEVIGLDPEANEMASARLARAIAEAGLHVRHLSPAPQCRRLEAAGPAGAAELPRVRLEFAPVARVLEGVAP